MKTLQLSVTKKVTYYLTSITEEQKLELYEAKRYNKLKQLSLKWGIPCDGVLKVGETDNITTSALAEFVGYFLGKDTAGIGIVGRQREIHFRNYNKTEEEQKRTAWLINQCQDSSASVRSAVKMMDEKWCVLWETPNEDSFKTKMDKYLENKVCFTENF